MNANSLRCSVLRVPKRVSRALMLAVLAGTPVAVSGEPHITSQPRSMAVLMDSNATFRVTAAGPNPLAYQWQLDGRNLSNATNAALIVSNVSLADLGDYTVIVRDSSDETKSEPAWLKLARWTELVVFDASLSLSNYSNGKSWVEWFAEQSCLSAPGQVKNYATGAASGADVRAQISLYLASYKPGPNTLLAPWWAGMTADLTWNHRTVEQVVSNYTANLAQLAQGGGRLFVLPTLVPLYLNPGLSNAYTRSLAYEDINARMDHAIQKLQADYGITAFRFGYWGLCTNLQADPTMYGFTNAIAAARAVVECDPNQYLWWDGVHPTTAFHHVISEAMYRCLTPPLVLATPVRDADGSLWLGWQGGSGPFRIQHADNVAGGAWQSGELTVETNQNLDGAPMQQFFRVLHLGQ